MLVRALIHDPEILVLDEPTGFMDAPSSRLTWDLLKKLRVKNRLFMLVIPY